MTDEFQIINKRQKKEGRDNPQTQATLYTSNRTKAKQTKQTNKQTNKQTKQNTDKAQYNKTTQKNLNINVMKIENN